MTATESAKQPIEVSGSSPEEPFPVDWPKVVRLRREIAAGTYAVDPDAVAAALLTAGVVTMK